MSSQQSSAPCPERSAVVPASRQFALSQSTSGCREKATMSGYGNEGDGCCQPRRPRHAPTTLLPLGRWKFEGHVITDAAYARPREAPWLVVSGCAAEATLKSAMSRGVVARQGRVTAEARRCYAAISHIAGCRCLAAGGWSAPRLKA